MSLDHVRRGAYPEQLKAEYKKRGYSVLAITDHEHLINYSRLTEEDFLFITGYEMFVFTLPSDHDLNQTSHLNMYSKTPENKMVYYSPETVYSRYAESGGILFITNTRNRKAEIAADGQTVNTAEFTLIPTDRYVRVEVTDANGNKAFTRAFFRNEIVDE